MAKKKPKKRRPAPVEQPAPRWWQDPQYRTAVFPTAGTAEDTRRRPGEQDSYTPEDEAGAKLWLVGIFQGPMHVGTIVSVSIAALAGGDAEDAESIAHQIAGDPTRTLDDWVSSWATIPEGKAREAVEDLRDNPQFEPDPSPATVFTSGHRAPSGEVPPAYWWQDKRYRLMVYPRRVTYPCADPLIAWIVGAFEGAQHVADIAAVGAEVEDAREIAARIARDPRLINDLPKLGIELGVEDLRNTLRSDAAPKPSAVDPGAPDPAPAAEPTRWWLKPCYRLETAVAGRENNEIACASVFVFRKSEDDNPDICLTLLCAFPVDGHTTANRAIWMADCVVRGEETDLDHRFGDKAQSIIDWMDQPEPPDPTHDDAINPWLGEYPSGYWDISEEFDAIYRHVETSSAPSTEALKIKQMFEAAQAHEGDDRRTPAIAMRRCIDAFHNLPPRYARKMLNGWHPRSLIPYSRKQLDESTDEKSLACVLTCHSPRLETRETLWSFDTVQDGSISPVRIIIRAGTDRATVIQAIDQIRQDIEHRWLELIDDPSDNAFHESRRLEREQARKVGAA